MKLSNDQKKIAKALAFFPIVNIVTLVIYHLIKGDIDWAEILLSSITSIVVAILFILLLVLGSKSPNK